MHFSGHLQQNLTTNQTEALFSTLSALKVVESEFMFLSVKDGQLEELFVQS